MRPRVWVRVGVVGLIALCCAPTRAGQSYQIVAFGVDGSARLEAPSEPASIAACGPLVVRLRRLCLAPWRSPAPAIGLVARIARASSEKGRALVERTVTLDRAATCDFTGDLDLFGEYEIRPGSDLRLELAAFDLHRARERDCFSESGSSPRLGALGCLSTLGWPVRGPEFYSSVRLEPSARGATASRTLAIVKIERRDRRELPSSPERLLEGLATWVVNLLTGGVSARAPVAFGPPRESTLPLGELCKEVVSPGRQEPIALGPIEDGDPLDDRHLVVGRGRPARELRTHAYAILQIEAVCAPDS